MTASNSPRPSTHTDAARAAEAARSTPLDAVVQACEADQADEAARSRTLAAYDYPLDPACVAQAPASPRDAARLLVLPATGDAQHASFAELPQFLRAGDLLVLNETRVLPARLHAVRPSGAPAELLPFAPVDGSVHAARIWRALAKPRRPLRPGVVLVTRGGVSLRVLAPADVERLQEGSGEAALEQDDAVLLAADGPLWEVMQAEGELPLPPYVARPEGPGTADAAGYQTAFARVPGAVAAPTASLHFTEQTFAALQERGVHTARLVLHVGPGTFLPVRREHEADIRGHRMHAEPYDVPQQTAAAVRATRARGGRVVAAGTTSLRALESWASSGAAQGDSRLFVRPGHAFRVVDALLTNFHLPRTTLMMLVSAMSGRARILAAYADAQARGYRFFSYGDATLLVGRTPPTGSVPGEPGFTPAGDFP